MLSEHKRVKHRELPGDCLRREKIAMRERNFRLLPSRFHNGGSKLFLKFIINKGRTVQRRRDKKAIQDGLVE